MLICRKLQAAVCSVSSENVNRLQYYVTLMSLPSIVLVFFFTNGYICQILFQQHHVKKKKRICNNFLCKQHISCLIIKTQLNSVLLLSWSHDWLLVCSSFSLSRATCDLKQTLKEEEQVRLRNSRLNRTVCLEHQTQNFFLEKEE